MVGLERTVVPAPRRAGVRPRVEDGDRLVHRELRRDQGAVSTWWRPASRSGSAGSRSWSSGWLLGLPVPFMIMWAPSWGWIDAANVLLGANQAFAWSMTVIMKVDLVGPQRRGLALGLNEFAGYLVRGVIGAGPPGTSPAGTRSGPSRSTTAGVVAILGLGLSVSVRPRDPRPRRARGRPDRVRAARGHAPSLRAGLLASRPGATGASRPPARRASSTT